MAAEQAKTRPVPLMGYEFLQALLDAGVVSPDELVTRVVIDARADGVVRLYTERIGDDRLLEVGLKTALEITTNEAG